MHTNKFELFKNIKLKPKWIDGVSFDEQDRDTRLFYLYELKKLTDGFSIGSFKYHPWLYWHTNFWKMYIDVSRHERILKLADLRDNELFINHFLLKAEEEGKGLIFFGTRRFGKSAFIASYIRHSATIHKGSLNSVVGGSQGDLDNITTYIDEAGSEIEPFLRYDKLTVDWKKGVKFGKKYANNEKKVFSTISITNVNAGAKRSSQKTAGGTPKSFVIDEIGKFSVKKTFNTAKYSFATPYGWRVTPILLGTSGEVELAQDAKDLVSNPSLHNLIEMDWDYLNKRVENPTWKARTWGIFVPAQMSIEPGLIKKKQSLYDYLGEEENDERLKNIEVLVTDWENATKILLEKRKKLENDPDTLNDETMFLPLDPDDVFLGGKLNPFPVKVSNRHLEKLKQNGDGGKKVELYRFGGKIVWEFSDKEIAPYPFKGGNIDAPILLFEDPPEEPERDGTYVGGLDHYKHDKSSTDSLGAMYIFKRRVNLDEWSNRLVACYVSRPSSIDKFNENAEMLMKSYGAEILQENADISFQQHLARKGEDDYWLANGEEFAKRFINPKARQNNKYGLPPTTKNQDYLLKLAIAYANEDIELGEDEEGNKIIIKGVETINDIRLLEEMINFDYKGNFDRIIAFGHALAWARYLDDLGVIPKPKNRNRKSNYYKEKKMKDKVRFRSPYGSRRGRFF